MFYSSFFISDILKTWLLLQIDGVFYRKNRIIIRGVAFPEFRETSITREAIRTSIYKIETPNALPYSEFLITLLITAYSK
jgi:hypothetical protein